MPDDVARTPRRRASVRGAGVVEYALGLSLILAVSLGAVSSLEEESSEAFEDRGATIGAPDLDQAVVTTTTTTAPSSGTEGTTTTTAPPTPPDSTVASVTTTSHTNGNRWTATVVVSITTNGAAVHKAEITATWRPNPGGSPISVTCETQPNGTCTFTLRNLATYGNSNHVASVDFTVNTVTPDGGTTTSPGLAVNVVEP